MLTEMDDKQLSQALAEEPQDVLLIYFYTPLCGTCQLADRMLTITIAALPPVKAASCNLNLMPNRAQEWQIESVPCLMIMVNGELREKIYAFHSVDYLYRLIKNHIS